MSSLLASTSPIDELLEHLVEELQVPQSRYESAERSYKSLGTWLGNPP